MSWTGFKKAINRAGTQVKLKTGNIDESVDEEFDLQEKNFKLLESNSKKMYDNLRNYHENLRKLIDFQINIAKTVDNFYGDYDFAVGDGISLDLLKILTEIKMEKLPEIIEPIDITILQPLKEFNEFNKEFNNLIKKRNHKKLDFDNLSHKKNKLEDELKRQHSNSIEKEKTQEELIKVTNQFNEASRVYNDLNENLKKEIEQFISIRSSIIDPSFESFIKIQNKVFTEIVQEFSKINDLNRINENSETELNKINTDVDNLLVEMKELSLTNLSSEVA
ncbi:hypothetical protein PACTADRAFT_52249 [Pachysolen tannophilus NRRL Y-2460]|uniref:BAR domain-containing protein n=1 Tax=Pachysolen tannophilus NRRL Y-2460 TaxID=669874 RepID=A0A1E4U0G5_PACTA|nr:hypothetical protein PACTADRAFT_52249 [Pachysolen tannophilus NRRL Y-2460]